MIIAIYINNLQILKLDIVEIHLLKQRLAKRFRMTDLGSAAYYLSIQITQNYENRLIHLSQEVYINKVLQIFGIGNCQSISTPIELELYLTKEVEAMATVDSIHIYQSAIGSLIYTMLATWPDLAYVISMLS